jgi:hypothetical protein
MCTPARQSTHAAPTQNSVRVRGFVARRRSASGYKRAGAAPETPTCRRTKGATESALRCKVKSDLRGSVVSERDLGETEWRPDQTERRHQEPESQLENNISSGTSSCAATRRNLPLTVGQGRTGRRMGRSTTLMLATKEEVEDMDTNDLRQPVCVTEGVMPFG